MSYEPTDPGYDPLDGDPVAAIRLRICGSIAQNNQEFFREWTGDPTGFANRLSAEYGVDDRLHTTLVWLSENWAAKLKRGVATRNQIRQYIDYMYSAENVKALGW